MSIQHIRQFSPESSAAVSTPPQQRDFFSRIWDCVSSMWNRTNRVHPLQASSRFAITIEAASTKLKRQQAARNSSDLEDSFTPSDKDFSEVEITFKTASTDKTTITDFKRQPTVRFRGESLESSDDESDDEPIYESSSERAIRIQRARYAAIRTSLRYPPHSPDKLSIAHTPAVDIPTSLQPFEAPISYSLQSTSMLPSHRTSTETPEHRVYKALSYVDKTLQDQIRNKLFEFYSGSKETKWEKLNLIPHTVTLDIFLTCLDCFPKREKGGMEDVKYFTGLFCATFQERNDVKAIKTVDIQDNEAVASLKEKWQHNPYHEHHLTLIEWSEKNQPTEPPFVVYPIRKYLDHPTAVSDYKLAIAFLFIHNESCNTWLKKLLYKICELALERDKERKQMKASLMQGC